MANASGPQSGRSRRRSRRPTAKPQLSRKRRPPRLRTSLRPPCSKRRKPLPPPTLTCRTWSSNWRWPGPLGLRTRPPHRPARGLATTPEVPNAANTRSWRLPLGLSRPAGRPPTLKRVPQGNNLKRVRRGPTGPVPSRTRLARTMAQTMSAPLGDVTAVQSMAQIPATTSLQARTGPRRTRRIAETRPAR